MIWSSEQPTGRSDYPGAVFFSADEAMNAQRDGRKPNPDGDIARVVDELAARIPGQRVLFVQGLARADLDESCGFLPYEAIKAGYIIRSAFTTNLVTNLRNELLARNVKVALIFTNPEWATAIPNAVTKAIREEDWSIKSRLPPIYWRINPRMLAPEREWGEPFGLMVAEYSLSLTIPFYKRLAEVLKSVGPLAISPVGLSGGETDEQPLDANGYPDLSWPRLDPRINGIPQCSMACDHGSIFDRVPGFAGKSASWCGFVLALRKVKAMVRAGGRPALYIRKPSGVYDPVPGKPKPPRQSQFERFLRHVRADTSNAAILLAFNPATREGGRITAYDDMAEIVDARAALARDKPPPGGWALHAKAPVMALDLEAGEVVSGHGAAMVRTTFEEWEAMG